MGVVHEAEHSITRERVALKTVGEIREDLFAAMRREIHLLRRLQHPGIVRLLADGTAQGAPWYAMELFDGGTLATWNLRSEGQSYPRPGAQPGRIINFVELSQVTLRLCETLSFLHREGVVHGDLKPRNIFLRNGDEPVLVDFGISWWVGGKGGREVLHHPLAGAGTPIYMSPEQIQGVRIDGRADLYALGCILYEMITGRPPFLGDTSEVIAQHLADIPAPLSTFCPQVGRELSELVASLLAKEPKNRIADPEDVIDLLRPRSAQPPRAPLLHRPWHAGRERLIQELAETTLHKLESRGGFVAITGESGVGKTHLVMEVVRRISASTTVVLSNCPSVQSASDRVTVSPLHPFRELLKTIASTCAERGETVTDQILGPRGPLLCGYEPSLEGLAGQTKYPPRSMTTGAAARARVVTALRDTIERYVEMRPVCFVIDDIQWVDELTLLFFQSLTDDWFETRRIMVLVTHRRDRNIEAASDVDHLLKRRFVERHDIQGLDAPAVKLLVRDMAGSGTSLDAFAEQLATLSHGNPFFVCEYLWTLFSEGTLRRFEHGRIEVAIEPTRAAFLGLEDVDRGERAQALVLRRLAGLNTTTRALIDAASVLGGTFAIAGLQKLSALEDDQFLDALRTLAALHILEIVANGRGAFVHESVAEVVHQQLSAEARTRFHKEAALELERHGGGADLSTDICFQLAHHFEIGCVWAKAIEYLERSALRAVAMGAYREGLRFWSRALALDDRLRAEGSQRAGVDRARWQNGIARTQHGLGSMDEAEAHARRALIEVDRAAPQSPFGWSVRLAVEVAKQLFSLLGWNYQTRDGRLREELRQAASASLVLTHRYFYVDDANAMLASSFHALNCARAAGTPLEVPRAYLGAAVFAGFLRFHKLARYYLDQADLAALQGRDLTEQVYNACTESVYHAMFADWEKAESAARSAETHIEELYDPFLSEMVWTMLGHVEYFTGRFDAALRRYERVLASARSRGNLQTIAWGLFSQARSLRELGELERANELLADAERQLETKPELQSEIICLGLRASVTFRLGDRAQARRAADAVLDRVLRASPTGFPTVAGYDGALEAYFGLLGGKTEKHLEKSTKRLLSALEKFARMVPVVRPAWLLRRGEWEALNQHPSRARRFLSRSLDEAEKLRMPREQNLASLALARLDKVDRRA